jgi:hypothetical protein
MRHYGASNATQDIGGSDSFDGQNAAEKEWRKVIELIKF